MRLPELDAGYARLLACLQHPALLQELTAAQLSLVIDAAADARLLGWLVDQIDAGPERGGDPAWLQDRLWDARTHVEQSERSVRWEIDRLHRALLFEGVPWVLLKGGGYVAAGLPPGRGRSVADIDILVPHEALGTVERALAAHGWQPQALNAYDEHYYRAWMHELPPFEHRERGSIVDIHHAILPLTSRLRPDSSRLLAQAITVGTPPVQVLSAPHMVLHGAAHLFHDGEVSGALRDLVDLDRLLRVFDGERAFWPALLSEARLLHLTRPAYYALRYVRRWFDTPVPEDVWHEVETWGPAAPVRSLMDALVARTLPDRERRASPVAALALYARSHWLKMPPLMLARHLMRKGLSRAT